MSKIEKIFFWIFMILGILDILVAITSKNFYLLVIGILMIAQGIGSIIIAEKDKMIEDLFELLEDYKKLLIIKGKEEKNNGKRNVIIQNNK